MFLAHCFYTNRTQFCTSIKMDCESEKRLKEVIVYHLVPSADT